LIHIAGKDDRRYLSEKPYTVADAYVPVGANRFRLTNAAGLHIGDSIIVEHPSTAAWIAALGMDKFPTRDTGSYLDWKPGTLDTRWDRVVTGIEGDQVSVDAPLTFALDAALAVSNVHRYSWPGRVSQVGIENLRCESEFDPNNPRDEEHAWMAITMEAAQNAWVRQVTTAHFAGAAVTLWENCKWVTIEDCRSVKPVSEIGGYRRHTFYSSGQMTLFQRCYSEEGRHDFAVGYLAAGPNAFVECDAKNALGFSGPIESWASGVLYDNITMDGGGLMLGNRETDDQGVGWAAANCVLWQCTAPIITCRRPPTANNWAVGCWGHFVGDGGWQALNEFVKPTSLYLAQLLERKGGQAIAALKRRSIPTATDTAKLIDEVAPQLIQQVAKRQIAPAKPLSLTNGWLTSDGKLLVGGHIGTVWWRGHVLPSRAGELGVGVTSFVPGRIGPGYTDDLAQLTDKMLASRLAALEHHWGLWYDRRRDDHEMVRRIDGIVWPPFYEQPWARSGKGTAWDGLSKYDLTKFNPWYFGRLKQFADLCDQKGLMLIHHGYFQHNILEAGAHWADFPWRPANCLQDTGFPEPPPYVNNKRIFMAEPFYDISNETRRALHRAYIRHCLDVLGNDSNVVFFTGEEFTGPLAFVQFWIDTVSDWQEQTGKKLRLGLSCTKDVQDAILADKVRASQISVIDMRYWWYAADGSLYAPKGGESLAPRQQLREWKGNKNHSDARTARQIREYRNRYPDKAILCSFDKVNAWAACVAGASVPNLPKQTDVRLLQALPKMQPIEPPTGMTTQQWGLAAPGEDYLVYSLSGNSIRLDLSTTKAIYTAFWIDPRTGAGDKAGEPVRGGRVIELATPRNTASVLWLTRNRD
jgi:hypothetical protein